MLEAERERLHREAGDDEADLTGLPGSSAGER